VRIEWTEQAEDMLDQALDYLLSERPSAALAWFEALMGQVRLLERFPDSGRVVPEYQRPEIRELLVDPYRVPYHRAEDAISILAVMHDRKAFDLDDDLG